MPDAEPVRTIRLRHKLALILPFGLGGLAVIGKLRDGYGFVEALIATHTIVVTLCGAAAATIVWLVARWLDNVEPGPVSLDDLIEMVEESKKPSHRYVVHWVNQMRRGLIGSVTLREAESLPLPSDFTDKALPTFEEVYAQLVKMNEIDGGGLGAAGFLVDGQDKTLVWEMRGDDQQRSLLLSLRDGPIEDLIRESELNPESASPVLRLRIKKTDKANPHNYSPERLAELNQYSGLVKGRFWRTFILWNLLASVVPMVLLGLFWCLAQDKDRADQFVVLFIFFLVLIFLVGVLMGAASMLTRAEVSGGKMRFRFAGMTRKEIPLELIDGYETLAGNSRRSIKINFGRRWHCPSGLLDHRRVADLLDACGIHQIKMR